MTMVSSYYAKVGVDVNKADFARVDRHFDLLQKRLDRFQAKTGKIILDVRPSINIAKAATSLNRQVQAAAKDITIHIRRFTINSKGLADQISNSLATKGGASRVRLNASLSQQSLQIMRQQVQTALSGMIISPRVRPVVSQPRGRTGSGRGGQGGSSGEGGSGSSSGLSFGSGGIGGWARLSRMGAAAIPFIAGAYGLSALNDATKTSTLSSMASQGIFSAATMPDGSTRNVLESSNDWIRKHAYDTGSSLPNILPSYQTFMSGAMPTQGYENSQEIFKAFSQFGTVRGASKESMQRGLTAVSQMAGKGQIMSEELKGQLAEAQGFGELPQIFAAAYQTKTGGKLVGSEAYSALLKAMEGGKVKSDILLDVSKILRQRSDPYITAAANTSSGWQNRAEGARFEFTNAFAKNGGDKAFAGLWQTIAEMTERASLGAADLGYYFNIGSLEAQKFLLYIEDLGKVIMGTQEGDSPFVKFFGKETADNIQALVSSGKELVGILATIQNGNMDSTKQQWKDLTNILAAMASYAVTIAKVFQGDLSGARLTFDDAMMRGATAMGITKLAGVPDYVPTPAAAGPTYSGSSLAPATFASTAGNNPSAFIGSSNTSTSNSINVTINNPTVTAAPGTSVSQAFGELTNSALANQAFSQRMKDAYKPKAPQ